MTALNTLNTTDLHNLIERALGAVSFVPPVSVAYAESVRAEILAMLPKTETTPSVEVYHRIRELVAEVRLGATVAKLVVPL